MRLRDAIAEATARAREHAETCRLSHLGDERQAFAALAAAFRSAMNDSIELRDHAHDWNPDTMVCQICGADGAA